MASTQTVSTRPIRIFAADEDDLPLSSFHQPATVAHIKSVLGFSRVLNFAIVFIHCANLQNLRADFEQKV